MGVSEDRWGTDLESILSVCHLVLSTKTRRAAATFLGLLCAACLGLGDQETQVYRMVVQSGSRAHSGQGVKVCVLAGAREWRSGCTPALARGSSDWASLWLLQTGITLARLGGLPWDGHLGDCPSD